MVDSDKIKQKVLDEIVSKIAMPDSDGKIFFESWEQFISDYNGTLNSEDVNRAISLAISKTEKAKTLEFARTLAQIDMNNERQKVAREIFKEIGTTFDCEEDGTMIMKVKKKYLGDEK